MYRLDVSNGQCFLESTYLTARTLAGAMRQAAKMWDRRAILSIYEFDDNIADDGFAQSQREQLVAQRKHGRWQDFSDDYCDMSC